MTIQTVLIVVLAALVAILSILLFTRIRREKRMTSAIGNMSLSDFSDFLRTNSVEGTIQSVAGRVSEFLKGSFGCQKILFLRKQRGFLELNYYHGVRNFKRQEFRMRFTRDLAETLREDFMPRPLDTLAVLLHENLFQRLQREGIDTYFPVFWRDNLYGIYFIKSTFEIASPSFTMLIAGLAQSLSAAYHIKWHESRYERLEQKVQSAAPKAETNSSSSSSLNMLKLVRHRNSASIVPRIVESIRGELHLDRLALVYESKLRDDPLMIWTDGIKGTLELPERPLFNQLCKELYDGRPRPVKDLTQTILAGSTWARALETAGLAYMSGFPITGRRSGVLAWDGKSKPDEIAGYLRRLSPHTRDLVENAESYERIEAMSYTDNLTGLNNQRYFHKRLSEETSRATRYKRSLGLIIFDLDDLKSINDRYGHLAGDTILKRLGQILKSSIRAIDIIARYGGDEFCVIMPEADGATCERFMERLKQKISSSKFNIAEADKELRCTISQGAALFPDHASTETELMHVADMALLRAKESGRNTYFLYDTENWPKMV
jgi:diguanylate cyclase (GGDEF)-like protein